MLFLIKATRTNVGLQKEKTLDFHPSAFELHSRYFRIFFCSHLSRRGRLILGLEFAMQILNLQLLLIASRSQ